MIGIADMTNGEASIWIAVLGAVYAISVIKFYTLGRHDTRVEAVKRDLAEWQVSDNAGRTNFAWKSAAKETKNDS